MDSPRILVVDDETMVRRCLRSLILSRPDWSVCGEAQDGLEAVEKARALRPDVVLMDVSMLRMNGVEATRIIRRDLPESEVIIVSQNDPAVVRRQAADVDARGFVAKANLGQELIPAIQQVLSDRNQNMPQTSKKSTPSTVTPSSVPIAKGDAQDLESQVESRFGILPNFFRLTPENPEIRANLWGFAKAAYLDNPLPSLFKERLFVYLSQFCEARYCIARHVGFLLGLGRSSGDAEVPVQTVDEVISLLRRPFPRGQQLQPHLSLCASCGLIHELPTSASKMEEAIFACASHVFLQTSEAPACLDALRSALGEFQLEQLNLFLAFVRTAHYWTKVHPELTFEDDIKHLLATHEALAECILKAPECRSDEVTEKLLEELPLLRKQADRATGLLAAIVEDSDDAIISKNLDGVITSWNKSAQRLFGYTAEEAIGQHMTLIIPADRWDEERVILARLRQGQRINHFETKRVSKDGTLIDISLTISPVKDINGRVVGASKVARDITERKRTEQALRQSEERLRALADNLEQQVRFRTVELQRQNTELVKQSEQVRELSQRLLQAQDNERRHIARELHDSAGQMLTALGMNLAHITQQAARTAPQLAKATGDAEQLVQKLNQEIRTTSYLLHPPLLDESGLPGALDWYTQGLMERSGLDIELSIPVDFGRLSPDMELAIFRVVQECLTNIHRHSGSQKAMIHISRDAENVSLQVEDEGSGLSPEKLTEIQSRKSGVGLRGMRERVHQFHGDMRIESTGHGTRISVTLPGSTNVSSDDVN